MSHTKGKLETRGYYAVNELGRAVFDCGPIPMEDEEIKANVRRLVACWNALSDVPTDDIENSVFIPPEVTYRELEKQRDELLEALRRQHKADADLYAMPHGCAKEAYEKALKEHDESHANVGVILAKYLKAKS